MSDTPETDSLLRGDDTRWSVNMVELRDLCRKMERERNQATERLNHAEIILSDLASGYWRSILNDQDPRGEGLMGERLAQYWARYSGVMLIWARYCEQESTTKP